MAKQYSVDEVRQQLTEGAMEDDLNSADNDGQIVLYSGVYVWLDSSGNRTYHDSPDPSLNTDDLGEDNEDDDILDA